MTAKSNTPSFRRVCLIGLGYFLIMLLYGLDRHWSFKTSLYDTGVFDQAIWSTLNGKPFHDSVIFSSPISWLGFHFHPILLLFVPLYAVVAAPEWLIGAQALAISLTALPIYLTAIKLNYSDRQAVLWAAAFLLNPFVISAAIWDFHPVALAAPLISASIYFLLDQQFGKLFGCIGLLLFCQEQMGLLVLCIGFAYYLLNRHALKSLAIMAAGLGFTGFLFAYWFPSQSPTGNHIMMTLETSSPNRYKWLGGSLFDIVVNFLDHPIDIARFCLLEMAGYQYIIFLLFPFGIVLPLIGYELLTIGTADLAANILSLHPLPRLISSYHSITLIPVIIAAAMLGLRRLSSLSSAWLTRKITLLLVVSFLGLFIFSIPHLLGSNSLWKLKLRASKDLQISKIQSMISDQASLSVQANVGPHFSRRFALYAYPNRVAEADFVILRIPEPQLPINNESLEFIHYLAMSPHEYLSSIRCLLHDGYHSLIYFNTPWLIFSKTQKNTSTVYQKQADQFLDNLEALWQLDNSRLKVN